MDRSKYNLQSAKKNGNVVPRELNYGSSFATSTTFDTALSLSSNGLIIHGIFMIYLSTKSCNS